MSYIPHLLLTDVITNCSVLLVRMFIACHSQLSSNEYLQRASIILKPWGSPNLHKFLLCWWSCQRISYKWDIHNPEKNNLLNSYCHLNPFHSRSPSQILTEEILQRIWEPVRPAAVRIVAAEYDFVQYRKPEEICTPMLHSHLWNAKKFLLKVTKTPLSSLSLPVAKAYFVSMKSDRCVQYIWYGFSLVHHYVGKEIKPESTDVDFPHSYPTQCFVLLPGSRDELIEKKKCTCIPNAVKTQ